MNLSRINRTFWHVDLYTTVKVTAWKWCQGAEICGSWYYVINGVLQSAFVGRYTACTNMYSINKVKIAECLVSAVSRLVCKQTRRELSTLYITELWMECLVFQVASLPQASPLKHCLQLPPPLKIATFLALLILLNLISQIIFGEMYKSLSYSLYS